MQLTCQVLSFHVTGHPLTSCVRTGLSQVHRPWPPTAYRSLSIHERPDSNPLRCGQQLGCLTQYRIDMGVSVVCQLWS